MRLCMGVQELLALDLLNTPRLGLLLQQCCQHVHLYYFPCYCANRNAYAVTNTAECFKPWLQEIILDENYIKSIFLFCHICILWRAFIILFNCKVLDVFSFWKSTIMVFIYNFWSNMILDVVWINMISRGQINISLSNHGLCIM